jgi:hypothetical protein
MCAKVSRPKGDQSGMDVPALPSDQINNQIYCCGLVTRSPL